MPIIGASVSSRAETVSIRSTEEILMRYVKRVFHIPRFPPLSSLTSVSVKTIAPEKYRRRNRTLLEE